MKSQIYFTPKNKLKLKRGKNKILLVPTILFITVLVLTIISFCNSYSARDEGHEVSKTTKAKHELNNQAKENNLAEGPDSVETVSGQSQVKSEQEEISRIIEKKVESGDTFSDILEEYLDPGDIYYLSRISEDIFPLNRIKAGQPYRLKINNGQLCSFEYDINMREKLFIDMAKEKISCTIKQIKYSTQKIYVSQTIKNSLFEAVKKCGETSALAVDLAEIFAWDIDFIRDVRSGDSFSLIVEKLYRQEQFIGYGHILAAKFVNQGNVFYAFRYCNGDQRTEYYNEQGQAVRKTFLKAPLNFTRISSGYSLHRKHPILNVVRPHRGIDYAAPRGTPIKSVADGVIVQKSYDREAGYYIKVRHNNGYVSIYNHMCKFARKIDQGSSIKQGQVIGYVGTTGLSTGAHLDYRVKRFGKYINPLHIESRPVKPLPQEEKPAFMKKIGPLMAVLEGEKKLYAQAKTNKKEN